MYKTFSADDYRKHFGVPKDYRVHSFTVFGTFRADPYEQIKKRLAKLDAEVSYDKVLTDEFFAPILEFSMNGNVHWFVVAYGGTLLSEWLHQACLFGSKKNIVVGSCGGLLKGAETPEIIVPTYAYANESATRMYEPAANCKHHSNEELSKRLMERLSPKHKVWHGPTVTCQAMMAETWDDVQRWSNEGYYGVEMEAATVFAVSNHFKVPSAAMLVIGDNLIEEQTVMDVNWEENRSVRQDVRADMLDAVLQEIL